MTKQGIVYLCFLVLFGILISSAYYLCSPFFTQKPLDYKPDIYMTKAYQYGRNSYRFVKPTNQWNFSDNMFLGQIISYDKTKEQALVKFLKVRDFPFSEQTKDIRVNCSVRRSYLIKEKTTLNGGFSLQDVLVENATFSSFCSDQSCDHTSEVCWFYE